MDGVDFFISVGLGIGGTDAPQVRSRKSMSNERTFSATKDEAFFDKKLGDIRVFVQYDACCIRLYAANCLRTLPNWSNFFFRHPTLLRSKNPSKFQKLI